MNTESVLPRFKKELTIIPADRRVEVKDQLVIYYVAHGYQDAGSVRVITMSTDAAHTDKLVASDTPWVQSPGLKGITTPLMTMPVPGREDVDGGSEHYVFSYDEGKKVLKYRTVWTSHTGPYISTLKVDDRPVVDHWKSMKNMEYPIATIPVPRRHNVDGRSEIWVLTINPRLQDLHYSTISVTRDAEHADALVVDSRPVADWWKGSLTGIGQLAEICPVPGRQDVDGKSEYYVFHRDSKRLLYRKISITCDAQHSDTLETGDRPVADHWPSLKGIE
ncbi:hypothetical protein [Streptomyces sp. NPDC048340]|uniref:hypothetical protein n=1 Tax=Streptomyces sp. NPDC048340 TaxID=3365537 RepID=UPI0037156BEC